MRAMILTEQKGVEELPLTQREMVLSYRVATSAATKCRTPKRSGTAYCASFWRLRGVVARDAKSLLARSNRRNVVCFSVIMPTLKEVAELAGVSVSTASLALNHNPRIKEPTRKKVLACAQALKYVPNRIGRTLKHGKPTVSLCWQ
jgi:hypothetical protein